MIVSFASKDTELLFYDRRPKRLPNEIWRSVRRKLLMIHAAKHVHDLRVPPGNRLEALHGDRRGQHSIRINDQWRICFRFEGGQVFDVEVVDYH